MNPGDNAASGAFTATTVHPAAGEALLSPTPPGACVDSQRFETRQRWIYRHELELLLRHAGFTRWDVRGGFQNEPLEGDDQQMIVWAWRD